MDVGAFRTAREKLIQGQPFHDPDKHRKILDTLDEAAAPEHVGENAGTGMSDQVKCLCGWESVSYWDDVESAWYSWREHVADEMGLNPKRCPCGKKYLPIDGETACHELRPMKTES